MGKHVNEADNKECAISDAKLVEIDKTFAMSKYEIRVKEFRAFKEHQHNIYSKILAPLKSYVTSDVNNEEFGCHHFQREGDQGRHDENMQLSWQRTGSIQTDEHPVVCVNWVQANQYANWLRQKTGQRYELPTTKEWEYAARSGTGAEQYWGNNDTEICKYANVHDEQSRLINKLPWKNAPCDDGYPKTTANGIIQTAPVGTFQKNPFHLHDMLGNVYEWVRDDGNTAGQSMMRGGSWNAAPDRVRAIGCYDQSKKYRGVDVGFRVVKYFK